MRTRSTLCDTSKPQENVPSLLQYSPCQLTASFGCGYPDEPRDHPCCLLWHLTDQCVSSTVRSLADESFDVIVVEDACAAATEALHTRELEIMNLLYCHVMRADELMGYLPTE